ncbi:MAG: hypothetical protein GY842_09480, partial [bacterium]|nr:hypothetical protein [bacterium]
DILWGGTGVFGAELMVDRWEVTDTSWATVSYCDVAGGEAGVYVGDGSTLTWVDGNLEVDPQFVDIDGPDGDSSTWADNDFHLAGASPCIDVGDPGFAPLVGETDLDGEARVQACRVDMGSDETTADPPSGDADEDDDVDLADFGAFQACFGLTIANPDAPGPCFCAFDFDDSGEIDLPDHVALLAALTGPGT